MAAVEIYNDVILQNGTIVSGVRGKIMRPGNSRTTSGSGFVSVNSTSLASRREYELGIRPMLQADWNTIRGLFEVTDGGAKGFLVEDPSDCLASDTEGQALMAVGGGIWQLHKRQPAPGGTRYRDRIIRRPRSPISLFKDGVPTGTGTVDYDTGQVVFAGGTGADVFTWSGGFYVPVQFASDEIDWELVVSGADRNGRYLSGPSVQLVEVME